MRIFHVNMATSEGGGEQGFLLGTGPVGPFLKGGWGKDLHIFIWNRAKKGVTPFGRR